MKLKKNVLVYSLDASRLGRQMFVLRTRGYRCEAAQNKTHALRCAAELPFDGVLLLATHEADHCAGLIKGLRVALPPDVPILLVAMAPVHLDAVATLVVWNPHMDLLLDRLKTLLARRRGPKTIHGRELGPLTAGGEAAA